MTNEGKLLAMLGYALASMKMTHARLMIAKENGLLTSVGQVILEYVEKDILDLEHNIEDYGTNNENNSHN